MVLYDFVHGSSLLFRSVDDVQDWTDVDRIARIQWGYYKENDLKEPLSSSNVKGMTMRRLLIVVQFSDSRWTAAPHRPQMPNQTNRPELTDKVRPVKDDTVGWPDELAIEFLDYILSWTTPRQTPPD
jgi:hypothetical protein